MEKSIQVLRLIFFGLNSAASNLNKAILITKDKQDFIKLGVSWVYIVSIKGNTFTVNDKVFPILSIVEDPTNHWIVGLEKLEKLPQDIVLLSQIPSSGVIYFNGFFLSILSSQKSNDKVTLVGSLKWENGNQENVTVEITGNSPFNITVRDILQTRSRLYYFPLEASQ